MNDQKVYQKVLRSMINQTNSKEINTSEQLLEKLVAELISNDQLLRAYVQEKDKIYG